MTKKQKSNIEVKEIEVACLKAQQADFVSITDIAKYKTQESPRDIIKNWLRSKNTIELLGLWEHLHNPNFQQVEFDLFRKEAGFNHFVLSPQHTRLEKLNKIAIGQMSILLHGAKEQNFALPPTSPQGETV